MSKRGLAILIALIALLLAGCKSNTTTMSARPYSGELQAQADALATQALAVALEETAAVQATRQVLDTQAQATSDTLAAQAQATRQVMDAQATQQALDILGTQEAVALHSTTTAVSIEATQIAIDTGATATAAAATATMQAAVAAVEGTAQAGQAVALEATSRHITRLEQREQAVEPLRTFGPWVLLLAILIAVFLLVAQAWRLYEDRSRVIRRQADEGEPLVLVSREQMVLPLRQFGPYLDAKRGEERAPLLAPTVEHQERATGRQQATNVILAKQAGKVAQAKSGAPAGVVVRSRKRMPREYEDPKLPPFRVRKPEELAPFVDDVRRQLLEESVIDGEVLDDSA